MKSVLDDLDEPNIYAAVAVLMMFSVAGFVLLVFLSDSAVKAAKKRLNRWWD